MVITSKRGNKDNVVTYEHMCDTREDMENIDPRQITIGTVCTVIKGEDDGLEVYMADSDKVWHPIVAGSGGDSSSSIDLNSIIIKFANVISEDTYSSIINNRNLNNLSNNEKMEIINLLIENAGNRDIWKDFIKTKYLNNSDIYYGYEINGNDTNKRLTEKGYIKEIYLPDNYTIISSNAFLNKTLSNYDYSSIENIHGKNIIAIYSGAFKDCQNLKTIDFPNLNLVEPQAFYNSSVEGIIKIGMNNEDRETARVNIDAFNSCQNITGLEANVSLINGQAFVNCQGLKYIFLKGYTEIKGGAFAECFNLEYAYIEDGIFNEYNNIYTIINAPKLKYLYLGPNISKIHAGAFGGTSINCKVQCGFSEGAIQGFPETAGFAGPIDQLDIEYDIPIEEALKPEDIIAE